MKYVNKFYDTESFNKALDELEDGKNYIFKGPNGKTKLWYNSSIGYKKFYVDGNIEMFETDSDRTVYYDRDNYNNDVTNVSLGKYIYRLDTSAFANYAYGENPIYNYCRLTSITLNEGLEEIGDYALAYTRLSSVKIPNSIGSINDNVFKECRYLSSVEFHDNIDSIGENAFMNNSLTRLDISTNNSIYFGKESFANWNVAYNHDMDITINSKGSVDFGYQSFSKTAASSLKINAEDDVDITSTNAFMFADNMTSIDISTNGHVNIGNDVFMFCSSLDSLDILAKSDVSLNYNAFQMPQYLTSINIESLEGKVNIGQQAFLMLQSVNNKHASSDRKNLSVKASDRVYIDYQAFQEGRGWETISLNSTESDVNIGSMAFHHSTFYDGRLDVSANGDVSIGGSAFMFCSGLNEVNITAINKATINISAFMFCSSLSAVNIKSKDVSFGITPFMWCNRITYLSLETDEDVYMPNMYFNGLEYVSLKSNNGTATIKQGYMQDSQITSLYMEGDGDVNIEYSGCMFMPRIKNIELISHNGQVTLQNEAFQQCGGLESIKLHGYNINIGAKSFMFCNGDYSVDIEADNYMQMSNEAFMMCTGMNSLRIHSPYVDFDNFIPSQEFMFCKTLTSIDIETVNGFRVGSQAFMYCSALNNVHLLSTDGGITIDYGAFQFDNGYECDIDVSCKKALSITTNSYNYPFMYCSGLRDVDFYANTIDICRQAFQFSGIDHLNINSITSFNIQSQAFQFTGTKHINFNSAEGNMQIGSEAFQFCSSLDTINMKTEGRIDIGWQAFHHSDTKEITFDCNELSISDQAFMFNEKLTTLNIVNEGYPYYGERSFMDCYSLENIPTLHNATVKDGAFMRCSALSHIEIDETTQIANNAFQSCGFVTLDLDNINNYGYSVFSYCHNLTHVSVSNMTHLRGDSFRGCDALTEVVIDDKLQAVENNVFADCTSLTSIVITTETAPWIDELSLDNVGYNGVLTHTAGVDFSSWMELLEPYGWTEKEILDYDVKIKKIDGTELVMTYEDGVIPYGAFNRNKDIVEVVIPNGIKKINDYAFNNCRNLSRITIGSNVEIIGDGVFSGCKKLVDIHAKPKIAPIITDTTFFDVAKDGTLYTDGVADYSSWMDVKKYSLGYYEWDYPTE